MSFPDFSAEDWIDGMGKLGVEFVQKVRGRLKPGDEAASAFESWQKPFEFAVSTLRWIEPPAEAELNRLFRELIPYLHDAT